MMKKVLLIEPNYTNKYPPIGLMKIATYFRNKGDWEVVFFKGDLRDLVIERITNNLVKSLCVNDVSTIQWDVYKDSLSEYIRTKKKEYLKHIPLEQSEVSPLLSGLIEDAKDFYHKKLWELSPEWDRVFVTTLFTFYWQETIDTINFAKKLVKDQADLMVGGVLASIQPKEIEEATGIKPHVGVLGPGSLDSDDKQNIDELELDYSILDEIEYKYPMSEAYYRYTTRGCVRHCPFCAVPTLEPQYCSYIPLKERLERAGRLYGEQKDLLLMDNNVLASRDFPKIIQEIIDCGYAKGALFIKPNMLEISIRNLKEGINDRAYIRKSWSLILECYESLKGEESYFVYQILEKYHLQKLLSCTKENLILAYEEIKDLYSKHYKSGRGVRRYVDFNQGVDARLFTQEKADLLGKIAIRPLRIAFDNIKTKDEYCEAIRMSVNAGIKDFSNYLLYNFTDTPDDLYERLKINVELCEEYKVSIYSFPMKYHPIRRTEDMIEDYSHNRDYIGKHWNRKYIRTIQAVLNSTKGKIGRGLSFFQEAFGENLDDYHKLLEMPETMIIYRFFFKWLGMPEGRKVAKELLGSDSICDYSIEEWWKCFNECKQTLSSEEWANVLDYIHSYDFNDEMIFTNPLAQKLVSYYSNNRKNVIENGSDLNLLKVAYDKNPILEPKRHKHKIEE